MALKVSRGGSYVITINYVSIVAIANPILPDTPRVATNVKWRDATVSQHHTLLHEYMTARRHAKDEEEANAMKV